MKHTVVPEISEGQPRVFPSGQSLLSAVSPYDDSSIPFSGASEFCWCLWFNPECSDFSVLKGEKGHKGWVKMEEASNWLAAKSMGMGIPRAPSHK